MATLPVTLKPQPARSAEQLEIIYGPLQFSLSVDSLKTFATTGEIDRELGFYARFARDKNMKELRQLLQRRFQVSPTAVAQITYSPMGEDFLNRLGRLIQTTSGLNGFYAMRAAAILSATQSEGFTLVDLMRRYPTRSIRMSAADFLRLQRQISALVDYKQAVLTAIATQTQAEIATPPAIDSAQLPDPRQPGAFPVTHRQLELQRPMQTLKGDWIARRFTVDLFVPADLAQPVPVVAISHGMGSTPSGFFYLGEHLASHGFAVAIPEHFGSGEKFKKYFQTGLLRSNVSPKDFIERPLDITQTLDELERLSQSDPALAGNLNFQQVGVIGHSFGGYTALAVGGAQFNRDRVRQNCKPEQPRSNLSIFLQCLSDRLPNFDGRLSDPRVKAIFAINPLTSVVFGPEGMGAVQVPTTIVTVSNDILTAPVPEQVHPFLWLKTAQKYLAAIVPAGHTAADTGGLGDQPPPAPGSRDWVFAGDDPVLTRKYIKALSLAFMQTYIGDRPQYQAMLTAAYAQSINQEPLRLDLVRSLTFKQLEQAYGEPPPLLLTPP
jgi:predicted dienelactone hydrolase